MSEKPRYSIRLNKVAKEFNVSYTTITEFLAKKGFYVDPSPNAMLTEEMYELFVKKARIRIVKAAKEFGVGVPAIRAFLANKGFQMDSSPNTKLTAEMYELLAKEYREKNVSQKPSSELMSMTLEAGNIHFFNGYYLIFQTNNGEIDNSVTPYRVDDPNSHEILNLVHKYFEQIFEQKRIIVKIDETKIIEPSRLDLFQLSNYVRELQRNLDEKKVWWEEVQNARKRSFTQCFGEPTESVKKRVSKSKNEFLYNLSSLQNEKKLIRVYEINHGKEEDAFIFTISMSNNRSAIVFEKCLKGCFNNYMDIRGKR